MTLVEILYKRYSAPLLFTGLSARSNIVATLLYLRRAETANAVSIVTHASVMMSFVKSHDNLNCKSGETGGAALLIL